MPEKSWQRVFPGEESQLHVMRKWLAGLLPASPQRDDLAVVATELGTNAIRHTASGVGGGQFIVEVTWHPAAVRVAVTDGGAPAGPRIINHPLSEHGRGLRVVQGMSALMGVTGNPAGRQVWADIPRDKAATAEPASPRAADEAIQAGLADLTSRFAGVPVWFGQTTQQWWALTRGQLVTASSVPGLAELLSPEPSSPARHTLRRHWAAGITRSKPDPTLPRGLILTRRARRTATPAVLASWRNHERPACRLLVTGVAKAPEPRLESISAK